jgi:hypothetical protein
MKIACFASYSEALRLLFIPQRCHSSSPYDRRHCMTEDDINDAINNVQPISFFNGLIIAGGGYGEHTGISFLSQSSGSSFATESFSSPK